MNTPSTLVSPGLGGFLAFFFLALALWLLMRNMNARMRRMSYAARKRQEELEARVRGQEGDTDAGADRAADTDRAADPDRAADTDPGDEGSGERGP